MAQQYLIGATDLDKASVARIGDRDSLDSYSGLSEIIRNRCGADVASLFAEPVRGFNRNTNTQNVTWFSAYEGTPYPFTQLDPAALKPVAETLRQRLNALGELFADPKLGPQLASWLYVLSPSDILSIAGQPVIRNWGMAPAEIAATEEAREAHFRRTIEPYAPRLPLPPFNGEEAQSFVQRLAQLAARDHSIAARATLGAAAGAGEAPPPPVGPASPRFAAPVSGRPWLAPLIATLVAAVCLAAIELLGLLVYPPRGLDGLARADLDTQKAANSALERRLDQLRGLTGKVCQAGPGVAVPPNGADFRSVLPAPPERSEVTPAATPSEPQPHPQSLADLLNRATVLVLTGDGVGSGFFVSDRHIVTNHHVAANFAAVKVGNAALGGLVDAKVLTVGSGRERGTQDIAVLEIDPKAGTEALRLAAVPAQLAPVTAAGFPGAVLETMRVTPSSPMPEANLTQGVVTSRQKQEPEGVGTIIHTATIGHGNSGGPLVDQGGCVVGVNSWLALDSTGDSIFQTFDQALDSAELRKFLDEKGVKYAASDAPCPAAVRPPGPAPAHP